MDHALFGLAPYHILLAGCGLVIIAAYWLPRFAVRHEPAASGLLILGGVVVFGFLPGMPDAFDPLKRPVLWELLSEVTIIVALFGTGLRIDRVFQMSLWTPTIRLLVVAMPLSVLAVALLGMVAGLSLAGAVLLAAALAPTDPVLARSVQVGPPGEDQRHDVRFSLTVEAGTEQSALEAAVSTAVWSPSEKLKADVSEYFGQLGPKAFAVTPPTDTGAQSWGSIHGAASKQEAQQDALQICSNVASQRGINLPCSLLFIENSQQPLGW